VTCVPCHRNAQTRALIDELAEQLKTRAHELEGLGISESDLYDKGVFRGAIERIRGQYSSDMSEKKYFGRLILDRLQDDGAVLTYESAGSKNRFDYTVGMKSGRTVVIEMKGCLDGNNTNIFERPVHANEFYIWSICQNAAADPQKNVWSGIHSRLSAEIIQNQKQVDGLIVWDMLCGSVGRVCPKLTADPARSTELGPYKLPPPCLYLFPSTIPSPRNNRRPMPHSLEALELLSALARSFSVGEDEVFSVALEAEYSGNELVRRTTIRRAGAELRQSRWDPIRRR
jgi:hypothetical protein